MDYPFWNIPIGGGALIGLVSIAHVLVSHFAVGGGLAIAIAETLSLRRRDPALRALAKRASLLLILVSTVFGAISGVAIWFTIGLVNPAATSALIRAFVWGWAAEWAFFLLELAAALAYYATWDRVRPRTHLLLIWVYAFAAYMSLVIIQGIIAFMLTPGRWIETHAFADGFFNPTYIPGLLLRTGICLFLAGAYMIFCAFRERDAAARSRLVRGLAALQTIGALAAYGGLRWWEAALPETVRGLFAGAHPLLPMLASTRQFLMWALAAYLLLCLFALTVPRVQRWPVAAAALLAAFAFFGGYERLREGARKPFVIRDHMFSNGIVVSEIGRLNERGVLSKAAWAAREAGFVDEDPDVDLAGGGSLPEARQAALRVEETVARGRAVFIAECAACHTLDNYLSIRKILRRFDADTVPAVLAMLREDGTKIASGEMLDGGRVVVEAMSYPFMPPLAGTEEEADALAAYLVSLKPPAPAPTAAIDAASGGKAPAEPAATAALAGGSR